MSSAGIRRTGQEGEQRGRQGKGWGGRYQNSGRSLLQHYRGPEGDNWEDKAEEGKRRVQRHRIEEERGEVRRGEGEGRWGEEDSGFMPSFV